MAAVMAQLLNIFSPFALVEAKVPSRDFSCRGLCMPETGVLGPIFETLLFQTPRCGILYQSGQTGSDYMEQSQSIAHRM